MKAYYTNYTHFFFEKLSHVYGFRIEQEVDDGKSYMIEFTSKNFVIKIEKYFREFYVVLCKSDVLNQEINLFNLLEYLKQDDEKPIHPKYYRNENDINECYRKQLEYISNVIYDNFDLLNEFFNDSRYNLNFIEFEKFWKFKHPELY